MHVCFPIVEHNVVRLRTPIRVDPTAHHPDFVVSGDFDRWIAQQHPLTFLDLEPSFVLAVRNGLVKQVKFSGSCPENRAAVADIIKVFPHFLVHCFLELGQHVADGLLHLRRHAVVQLRELDVELAKVFSETGDLDSALVLLSFQHVALQDDILQLIVGALNDWV